MSTIKLEYGDIAGERTKISQSTELIFKKLKESLRHGSPIDFFHAIKFEKIGCDPLDTTEQWNLIEQINQTFTYLASLKASEILFEEHKSLKTVKLNLGTTDGYDLIGTDSMGNDIVVAEVFATVNHRNNAKLRSDIEKVMTSEIDRRYVFFAADNVQASNPYVGYKPKSDISRLEKVIALDHKKLWI